MPRKSPYFTKGDKILAAVYGMTLVIAGVLALKGLYVEPRTMHQLSGSYSISRYIPVKNFKALAYALAFVPLLVLIPFKWTYEILRRKGMMHSGRGPWYILLCILVTISAVSIPFWLTIWDTTYWDTQIIPDGLDFSDAICIALIAAPILLFVRTAIRLFIIYLQDQDAQLPLHPKLEDRQTRRREWQAILFATIISIPPTTGAGLCFKRDLDSRIRQEEQYFGEQIQRHEQWVKELRSKPKETAPDSDSPSGKTGRSTTQGGKSTGRTQSTSSASGKITPDDPMFNYDTWDDVDDEYGIEKMMTETDPDAI